MIMADCEILKLPLSLSTSKGKAACLILHLASTNVDKAVALSPCCGISLQFVMDLVLLRGMAAHCSYRVPLREELLVQKCYIKKQDLGRNLWRKSHQGRSAQDQVTTVSITKRYNFHHNQTHWRKRLFWEGIPSTISQHSI